jgi:hypothetical protein
MAHCVVAWFAIAFCTKWRNGENAKRDAKFAHSGVFAAEFSRLVNEFEILTFALSPTARIRVAPAHVPERRCRRFNRALMEAA